GGGPGGRRPRAEPKGGEEGGPLPGAAGPGPPHPRPPGAAAVAAGHVAARPGLVEEDQPPRAPGRPLGPPLVALCLHIRPVVLRRPEDFFFTLRPRRRSAFHRVARQTATPS